MKVARHPPSFLTRVALIAIGLALLPLAARAETAQVAAGQDALPPVVLKTPKFNRAFLAPVDGLSVRDYAHLVFQMFAGDVTDNATFLASHGVTQAQFDHANEAMTKRMQDDPTRKFIDIYGAYFIENAPGPFAAYAKDVANSVLNDVNLREKEPFAWDEYMRLQGYYARKAPFARDTSRAAYDEILADQGMNFIDFQVLGAWYGRKMARDVK